MSISRIVTTGKGKPLTAAQLQALIDAPGYGVAAGALQKAGHVVCPDDLPQWAVRVEETVSREATVIVAAETEAEARRIARAWAEDGGVEAATHHPDIEHDVGAPRRLDPDEWIANPERADA